MTNSLQRRVALIETAKKTEGRIFVRMHPADATEQQARARWLSEHPDRAAALEGVCFIRRVLVGVPATKQEVVWP